MCCNYTARDDIYIYVTGFVVFLKEFIALYYWYIELFIRKIFNFHAWIPSCPDGITPNSGLTGPYIYIYIYICLSIDNETFLFLIFFLAFLLDSFYLAPIDSEVAHGSVSKSFRSRRLFSFRGIFFFFFFL